MSRISLLFFLSACSSAPATKLSITAPATVFDLEQGTAVSVPIAIAWPAKSSAGLSVTGKNLPSGVTVTAVTQASTPLGAITVTAASTAVAGAASLSLTATLGGESSDFSIAINVTSPSAQLALALVLAPISATVPSTGSTSATLGLITGDSTTAVSLALQSADAAISAVFPTLSLAQPTASVTFTTTGLAPGSHSFNVVATQGAQSATAPFTLVVPALEAVTITVTDPSGFPLAACTASIGAQTAITDSSGEATFVGVTTPYDVRVVWADTPDELGAYVIHGLSNPQPQLVVLVPGKSEKLAANNTAISGSVLGSPAPAATDKVALVVDDEDFAVLSAPSITPFGSGAFTFNFRAAESDFVGLLWALTWQVDSNNLPTLFTGAGSLDLDFTAEGGVLSPVAVGTLDSVALPANNQFSGTITAAPGYFVASQTYSLRLTQGQSLPISSQTVSEETSGFDQFNYPMVAIANAFDAGNFSFLFEASAIDASGDTVHWTELPTLAAGDEEVDLTLPAALGDFSPANNATGFVAATPLTWTNSAPATTLLAIHIGDDSVRNYDITCVTQSERCDGIDFTDLDPTFAFPSVEAGTIDATQIFGAGVDQVSELGALNAALMNEPAGRALWATLPTVAVTTE